LSEQRQSLASPRSKASFHISAALINQVKNAPTRTEFKTDVAKLILEWLQSSDAFNSPIKAAEKLGYGLIQSAPQDAQEEGWMDLANHDEDWLLTGIMASTSASSRSTDKHRTDKSISCHDSKFRLSSAYRSQINDQQNNIAA